MMFIASQLNIPFRDRDCRHPMNLQYKPMMNELAPLTPSLPNNIRFLPNQHTSENRMRIEISSRSSIATSEGVAKAWVGKIQECKPEVSNFLIMRRATCAIV
jgi:hypothetical protein